MIIEINLFNLFQERKHKEEDRFFWKYVKTKFQKWQKRRKKIRFIFSNKTLLWIVPILSRVIKNLNVENFISLNCLSYKHHWDFISTITTFFLIFPVLLYISYFRNKWFKLFFVSLLPMTFLFLYWNKYFILGRVFFPSIITSIRKRLKTIEV